MGSVDSCPPDLVVLACHSGSYCLKVSPLFARLISVPDNVSMEELHDVPTLCSSFLAGADERSATSASTAKKLADDATCEPASCANFSFGAVKSSYTPTTSSLALR